jgi:hypothetical protein
VRIKGIGGALRGFAAAQIVVSSTIQIEDSSIRQRHQRRRQWQKAEAVSCVYWRCSRRRSDNRRQMNTTDKVGEENNERIVIDNEMMDYE